MAATEPKKAKVLLVGDGAKVASLPEPEQRVFDEVAYPLVLQATDAITTLKDACQWLTANQDEVLERLKQHGAILFRGFPFVSADDFDAFVCAFKGLEDLPYEKSLSFAVRIQVTNRVCTTNEGKKGGQVFHHEQAQTPFYPSKLFFFCESPAPVGGGTAVCPSGIVLQRLKETHTDFYSKLKKEGVKYTAVMSSAGDASKGAGRGWKSFFGRDTKEAVEERMTTLGYTWEWLEGDVLRATSPVLSGIRTAPGTDTEVFFNQIVAQASNIKEFSGTDTAADASTLLSQFMTFGDGTPMDVKIVTWLSDMCEEVAVELNWQAGDVALLDNFLVMHARRQFEGPRRVLASLVH
eukprot:m.362043 g.362043  ORF g.362043 m.362043 type:complete len:351 (-) comp20053_c0_seq1:390-1442(-)